MIKYSFTQPLDNFVEQVGEIIKAQGTPLNFEIQSTAWDEDGVEYVTITIIHAGHYYIGSLPGGRFVNHPYLENTCCGPTWSCDLHKLDPPPSGTFEQRSRDREFT